LLGLHRIYEAMEEFQQAEDLDPENPELEIGRRFRRKAQLDDLIVPEGADFGVVIKRADAALLMRDQVHKTSVIKALIFTKKKNANKQEFEEANRLFAEIIALDPKNADHLAGRAAARLKVLNIYVYICI
jgi:tetratricopeptide (TPR) repeat protein